MLKGNPYRNKEHNFVKIQTAQLPLLHVRFGAIATPYSWQSDKITVAIDLKFSTDCMQYYQCISVSIHR